MAAGYVISGRMNSILNIIVPAVLHPRYQFRQKAINFILWQMISQVIITKKNVADNWCGRHPNMKIPPGKTDTLNIFVISPGVQDNIDTMITMKLILWLYLLSEYGIINCEIQSKIRTVNF